MSLSRIGIDLIGAGIFDFGLHESLWLTGDAAFDTTISQAITSTNTIGSVVTTSNPRTPLLLDSRREWPVPQEEPPCENCKANKRERYCCDTVTRIGTDCKKSKLLINGIDFNDILKRLSDLEKYVVSVELEKNTKLPSELCTSIANYF